MIADLWIMQQGIAEGHVIVFDMDGVVLGHLARMSLMTMKRVMVYLQVKINLMETSYVNIYNISTHPGSVSGTPEGSALLEHRVVHGQGAGPDEAVHEERTVGCVVPALDARHFLEICTH